METVKNHSFRYIPTEKTNSLKKKEVKSQLDYDNIKLRELSTKTHFKILNDALEGRKLKFKSVYFNTLLKEEYIEREIEKAEQYIQDIKKDNPITYMEAINGYLTIPLLTEDDAKYILDFDVKKASWTAFFMIVWSPLTRPITPTTFIINITYLKWLWWFKAEQAKTNLEPSLHNLPIIREKGSDGARTYETISSYKWQGKPDNDLPELFKLMKGKLIDKNSTLEQFQSIFSNEPLEYITPLKWHENNKSELLYFISQLRELELIEGKDTRMNYEILRACFVQPDGQPFSKEFRSLHSNLDLNLSNAKKQPIDDLVKQFL